MNGQGHIYLPLPAPTLVFHSSIRSHPQDTPRLWSHTETVTALTTLFNIHISPSNMQNLKFEKTIDIVYIANYTLCDPKFLLVSLYLLLF